MAEVSSYATGQPSWADVTSPDVDAAASFYSELFGWEAAKAPQPEAGGYTMFLRDGKVRRRRRLASTAGGDSAALDRLPQC